MELDLGFMTRSRVRLIRQTEVAECGLASLTMVANYHGLDIALSTMRRRYSPSMRGAPLRALINLADNIGLTPRAVKLPLEELGNLHMPAVLHWDLNHYVVIEAMKGGKALIHNPDGRSTWTPLAEVSDHFTGVALELRPSNDFNRQSLRERAAWNCSSKTRCPPAIGLKSLVWKLRPRFLCLLAVRRLPVILNRKTNILPVRWVIGKLDWLIPKCIDQDPWAHCLNLMDMMRHG